MVGDRQQFAREPRQALMLSAGCLGFGRTACFAQQAGLLAPAGFERGIEFGCSDKGCQRIHRRSVCQCQMPLFLPRAAIFGHFCMKLRQTMFCAGQVLFVTRGDSGDVQRLSIARIGIKQALRKRAPLGKVARLQGLLGSFEGLLAIRHCVSLQSKTAEANHWSAPAAKCMRTDQ